MWLIKKGPPSLNGELMIDIIPLHLPIYQVEKAAGIGGSKNLNWHRPRNKLWLSADDGGR